MAISADMFLVKILCLKTKPVDTPQRVILGIITSLCIQDYTLVVILDMRQNILSSQNGHFSEYGDLPGSSDPAHPFLYPSVLRLRSLLGS